MPDLGTWYGGSTARLDTRRGDGRRELVTPERLRRHSEDVLDGEVTEGPLRYGSATWTYAGPVERRGPSGRGGAVRTRLGPSERAQLEELGETTALRFIVSKDDPLLRRLELDLELGGNALHGRGAAFESVAGTVVLRLADSGKPVIAEPPKRYCPLEDSRKPLRRPRRATL